MSETTSGNPAPSSESDSDAIDLRELVATLLDGKWWIAGFAAVCLAIGLAHAFLARPVYQANVLLQIKKPTDILSGLNKIQEMLGAPPPAATEIQIIRSRAVLLNAIAARNLTVSAEPAEFPLIGRFFTRGDPSVEIASLGVPENWYGKTLRLVASGNNGYTLYDPAGTPLLQGQVGRAERTASVADDANIDVTALDAHAGTVFKLVREPALDVYRALNKKLGVAEQGLDTGILLMTLEGHDPAAIAATLNAIADSYVTESSRLQALQATKSLGFINQQLPLLQAQANQAQAALSDYETKQGRVELSVEAQALLNQAAQVQEQITKVDLQNAALAQQFTANNPTMQAIDQQRAGLLAQKSQIESAIRSLPQTQQQLVALTRDAKVANDVYSYLLGKGEQFKIQKAGSIGNARLIDLAVPPIKPIAPRKGLEAILALIVGLFLGTIVVFLRRAFLTGASDPQSIERATGLPVYAVIPHSREQQVHAVRQGAAGHRHHRLLLMSFAPEDAAVEALRSLRTSLSFALAGARDRLVTIGGSRPDIGKSFISANLAHLLAGAGKRVVIVDADLRRGRLHEYFGAKRHPGLSQILVGQRSLQQCLVHSPLQSRVLLLPTGVLPPNPSELLMGHRLSAVLKALQEHSDVVLIDLPPYLAVTDGFLIAAKAATNLVVLKAGLHPMREIDHVVSRMRQNHIAVTGFVLNDLSPKTAHYGYRKYGYAYSYKYSKQKP
ncbi:MAG: polysaccharide biosynthesis tyrosine autokinase [Gammaproteobacteria bacterium]